MIKQDDRTAEQKETHTLAVVGTDSFLSGWGHAANGASYAGWACIPDDLKRVEEWVESRGDMKRVRIVLANDYNPSSVHCVHFHLYVVGPEHPALRNGG